MTEPRGEIAYGAAALIAWFAEEGQRVYRDTIPAHVPDKRCRTASTMPLPLPAAEFSPPLRW
jgi:hypothetical protein